MNYLKSVIPFFGIWNLFKIWSGARISEFKFTIYMILSTLSTVFGIFGILFQFNLINLS